MQICGAASRIVKSDASSSRCSLNGGVTVISRIWAILILAMVAVGCASPRSQSDNLSYAADLAVCRNAGSNLPDFSPDRRILGYSPTITVAGRQLLRAPVDGCLSSGFGRRSGGAGSQHKGIDLYTGNPRPIRAAADGVIEFRGRQSGFGNVLIVDHGQGVSSVYAHISSFATEARVGARVRQGAIIASSGRTGNATGVHLHFEIRLNNRPLDPLDLSR